MVQPQIVVPGEWLVDKDEKFLFLPLNVPPDMPLDECKVMCNGDQILVIVTEQPKDKKDSKAVKKYKMIMEALKKEVGYDEKEMKSKLQTWYDTEEDEEVAEMVGQALEHLKQVRGAKTHSEGKTISVPLGMLAKEAAKILGGISTGSIKELNLTAVQVSQPSASLAVAPSFLARASVHNTSAKEPAEVVQAERVLPLLHRATTTMQHMRVGIIKESFAVEIPYPVPVEKIFILQGKDSLMVTMPLMRNTLDAKGISTGGKPFLRTPIFNDQGLRVAGPGSVPMDVAAAQAHRDHVNEKEALKPLPG